MNVYCWIIRIRCIRQCLTISSIVLLEFVFRSSMLCVLYSHVSLSSAVFISPLLFGLAHFHHMLEHFYQNAHAQQRRVSSSTIIFSHVFQFAYTYVFGVYSSFLFLRTGHFIPSFIAHGLCNGFGVPDFSSLFDRHETHRKRQIIFILSYLMGLGLFLSNLFVLTDWKYYYANEKMLTYRYWTSSLWLSIIYFSLQIEW
jgi:prenyl protein peptidase